MKAKVCFFQWFLVCVMWISHFEEWGKTHMTSEIHLHRNLLIICMNKFHSNDLDKNINNMIMDHLHTLLKMFSIQTEGFVQSSVSKQRNRTSHSESNFYIKPPSWYLKIVATNLTFWWDFLNVRSQQEAMGLGHLRNISHCSELDFTLFSCFISLLFLVCFRFP